MILHAAEIWAALAGCFILGALAGSIFHRAIALTAASRAQASIIRGIDRVVRALERILMPWRGSVPANLPQTVPMPPPDFSHVVDVPELHVAVEPYVPRHMAIDPFASERLAEAGPPPPSYAPPEPARLVDPAGLGDGAGFQPLPLQAPRHGVADPLHLIAGLTEQHAGRLAEVGIFHFSQIASWTPQESAWIAAYLDDGDTIFAQDWVGRAMHFASADGPILAPEPIEPAAPKPKAKSRAKRPKVADKTVADAQTGEAGSDVKKAVAKTKAAKSAVSKTTGTPRTKSTGKKRAAPAKGGEGALSLKPRSKTKKPDTTKAATGKVGAANIAGETGLVSVDQEQPDPATPVDLADHRREP